MIASMTTTQSIVTTGIEFEGVTIAFDLYHGGYHAKDCKNLIANLTNAGNTVIYINETWELSDDVDVLFLTEADSGEDWTPAQQTDVANWMSLGNKLLWGAGDSDYGGLFNQSAINGVLDGLGGITRLDATSIADTVWNDGADYRVAAVQKGYGDSLYDAPVVGNLTKNYGAGNIFHGPCSIVGYLPDDPITPIKDLRYGYSVFPQRVWIVLRYSENATSGDADTSEGPFDLYANITLNPETGSYPAMTVEYLPDTEGYVILTGEAIYSDYKYMYDQKTENGLFNGGVQFGQVVVNNALNYFLPPPVEKTSYTLALIPLAFIGVIYAISRKRK